MIDQSTVTITITIHKVSRGIGSQLIDGSITVVVNVVAILHPNWASEEVAVVAIV